MDGRGAREAERIAMWATHLRALRAMASQSSSQRQEGHDAVDFCNPGIAPVCAWPWGATRFASEANHLERHWLWACMVHWLHLSVAERPEVTISSRQMQHVWMGLVDLF